MTTGLIAAAAVAAARLDEPGAVRATRLLGTTASLSAAHGSALRPTEQSDFQRTETEARAALSVEAFTAAWEEGQALTLEQALAEAELVAATPPTTGAPTPATRYPAGLTEREVEVLRLVAQGLTNPQVAERLIISPVTVNTHLRSIHNKLGVSSRTAAARFAIEHGLV